MQPLPTFSLVSGYKSITISSVHSHMIVSKMSFGEMTFFEKLASQTTVSESTNSEKYGHVASAMFASLKHPT